MSLYFGSKSHARQVTFLMFDLHVETRANGAFKTQLSEQWLLNKLNWKKNIHQTQGPSLNTVSKSSASLQQWQSFTHRYWYMCLSKGSLQHDLCNSSANIDERTEATLTLSELTSTCRMGFS